MIEIPYIEPIIDGSYSICKNKKNQKMRINPMPISQDMIECFKQMKELDFIILCFVPLIYTGEKSKNKIVKIDMKDIEGSLRKEKIFICDSFNFYYKNTNEKSVVINIENNEK